MLFGSVAAGRASADSDLDLAVSSHHVLSVAENIALTQALAEASGRPIDLIDLATVAEPLLGQIVQHGTRIWGSDTLYANLISRYLVEQADFMPYQSRILAERRTSWIGR